MFSLPWNIHGCGMWCQEQIVPRVLPRGHLGSEEGGYDFGCGEYLVIGEGSRYSRFPPPPFCLGTRLLPMVLWFQWFVAQRDYVVFTKDHVSLWWVCSLFQDRSLFCMGVPVYLLTFWNKQWHGLDLFKSHPYSLCGKYSILMVHGPTKTRTQRLNNNNKSGTVWSMLWQ